ERGHAPRLRRRVHIRVPDPEVYSNPGGPQSKATPLGAAAKFAAAGKRVPKKDLGLMAMAAGHAYVARVALGARDAQALRVFQEAESYRGPSLIIALSPCIAHGYDLRFGAEQQKRAVESGYWPVYHYDPRRLDRGETPLVLDTTGPPKRALAGFVGQEGRYRMAGRRQPEAEREEVGGVRGYGTWGGPGAARMNLATTYLGLALPHPLMPGASPLVDDLDMVRRLEDAGAAAIVMHSLFEEQIAAEEQVAVEVAGHGDSFGEALSYLPGLPPFALGPDRYLEQLRRIR